MNCYIWLTTASIATLIVACGTTSANKEATDLKPIFMLAEPPLTIVEDQQRTNFLAEHYWSVTDFADTALRGSRKAELEEAVVGYLYMLPNIDSVNRIQGIKDMYRKTLCGDSTMFWTLHKLAAYHLNHPNSYMRNEDLYIQELQALLSFTHLSPTERLHTETQLALAQKNRPGQQAENFSFVTRMGAKGTLYGMKSNYTLLFFNAPNDEESQAIKKFLVDSPVIDSLVAIKQLTIIALYTGDQDSLWHRTDYPKQWINAKAFNDQIERGRLCGPGAWPSLLLVDRKKQVLLKDARTQLVESHLATAI